MNSKYMNRRIFFIIFLSLLCLNFIYSYSAETTYETGTNIVTADINFVVIVEEEIKIEAEDAHLDFGDIIRGSNETRKAETKIKVTGGKGVTSVRATYEDKGEMQKDGSRKIQIYREEENKDNTPVAPKNTTNVNDEVDTIDVYMLPFETSYKLTEDEIDKNKTIGEIPVYGEIRGIGTAGLGKYSGMIQVNIEALTTNNGTGEGMK